MDKRRTGFANGVRTERHDHDLIRRVVEMKRKLADASDDNVRAA